ncbi:MAG: tetratricopeptide repeat protein [Proteobacteria bacterium]|nr:tetratricopeptide repeat protein [Pseudomonadota bacterium]
MTKIFFHKCAIGIILVVLLLPVALHAGEHTEFKKLPLAVRMVLSKINPMLEKKEYQHAEKTLQTFLARGGPLPESGEQDPRGYHHCEIYFTLGNCYLLQEQYKSAIKAYDRAVTRNTSHAFAWLNMAKACYELQQYSRAAHCFLKGYENAEEKNPEYLYFSAAANLMAKDYQRSIKVFELLLAAHTDAVKPEWKENLVHALLADDQARRALPYIRELAHIYTGDKQIQWQEILLYQYVQLNMSAEALDLALTLTGQAPTVEKWWKALVNIRLNDGQYEEALAALTMYAFLTPLTFEEKKLLADLSLQVGIPVKAVPVYETCLKEKADKQILQHLAMTYLQLGNPETALEVMNKFRLTPEDKDLMMLKGELLYALKQYDKAAEAYLLAARDKGPKSGHAWLMAGYAAWQINDFPASRKAFTKASGYDREKKAAISALNQLKGNFMP